MNKRIKAKWLKALRSGEYSQGKGLMVTDQDKFCCLGVLCNLAPASVGEWEKLNYEYYFGKEGDSCSKYLPSSVMTWAGLDSDNPHVDGNLTSLADMNDDGFSFAEIADEIEKSL